MSTRLYVGNLPYSTTIEELRRHFSQVGTVESVEIPLDRDTGRPRGFGFVQMASDQEAQAAIRKFDNSPLDGRQIRVNVAQERGSRPASPYRRAC